MKEKLLQLFRMTANKSLSLSIAAFSCVGLAFLVILSCGQDYNSNSGDEALGGGVSIVSDCGTPAAARLCAAMKIISSQCLKCHADWAAYNSDQAWIKSGLVVPQSTSGSKIISRLINAGSNMPLGGSALSEGDYKALQEWVTKLEKTSS